MPPTVFRFTRMGCIRIRNQTHAPHSAPEDQGSPSHIVYVLFTLMRAANCHNVYSILLKIKAAPLT